MGYAVHTNMLQQLIESAVKTSLTVRGDTNSERSHRLRIV